MSGELSCSACLRPEVVQSGGVVVEKPEFAIRADFLFLTQHRYRIRLSGRPGVSVVNADNQVVPTGVFEDPGYIVVCPPGDQDVMGSWGTFCLRPGNDVQARCRPTVSIGPNSDESPAQGRK